MQDRDVVRARWGTLFAVALLGLPVALGVAGTMLPAFGYLPALGARSLAVEPFIDLFAVPGLTTSILLSLGTGLAATAASLAIALLFTAAWSETAAFRTLTRLLSPLLSVPHAAAAFGLAFLIAPSGFIVRLLSPWATGYNRPPDVLILNDPAGIAMTVGLITKELPFLFLVTLAALPQVNAGNYVKVAANLGYGRLSGFIKIIIPRLYPQIRLPVLAVLAYSTSVVDVATILGPTTPAPLAPRILGWFNDPDSAIRLQASAAAIVQLLVSLSAIAMWVGLEKGAVWFGRVSIRRGARGINDLVLRQVIWVITATLVVATLAGLVVLTLWSVTRSWWFPAPLPTKLTFDHWARLFEFGAGIVGQTILIAAPVTICCVVIVVAFLQAQPRDPGHGNMAFRKLIFLPLLIPQISFLFGLQVTFVSLRLDGTVAGVALIHALFVLPYAFLALADPWHHLDPRYARVARSLGASDLKVLWRVKLPLLLRPLSVTFAIAFAVSIGQYLPTVMIGSGRITTVTTESVALASGGNRSLIAVYAMIQLILPCLAFAAAGLIPAVAHRNRTGLRLQS